METITAAIDAAIRICAITAMIMFIIESSKMRKMIKKIIKLQSKEKSEKKHCPKCEETMKIILESNTGKKIYKEQKIMEKYKTIENAKIK